MFKSVMGWIKMAFDGQSDDDADTTEEPSDDEFEVTNSYPKTHLLGLNDNVREKIFSFLTYQELGVLRKTCKLGRLLVNLYIDHYLASFERKDKLKNLIQTQSSYYFLPKEESVLNRIGQNIQSRLKMFYFVKNLLVVKELKSFPIENAIDFPHLGNPSYIIREHDASLNRTVVHLQQVCWLSFVIDLGFFPKGLYQVRLHLFADHRIRWPSWRYQQGGEVTTISLRKVNRVNPPQPGAGDGVAAAVEPYENLLTEEIPSQDWIMLGQGNIGSLGQCQHSRIIANRSFPNWFYFEFEPIVLEEETELDFLFKDIDNPNWKSGMKWDVVEVRKLEHLQ